MPELQLEKKLLKGTILLTLTSFIVKVLSAIYRVPFQNLVGDEGFYVYQQVYPIYGLAMTFSLTGLPVFISKILSEETQTQSKKNISKQLMLYISILSVSTSLLLFLGSTLLATWMGDKLLAPVIQVVSLVFLFIPFLSITRGYFQSELDMKPTALSQLFEQGVRVFVILYAGFLFTKSNLSVYQVGSLATAGSLVGAFFAAVILWLFFRKRKKTTTRDDLEFKKNKYIFKRLIIEGGTLCLFSAYLILFQLIDSFTVKKYLVYGGLSDLSAKIAKGVFDRGQPLVQLGLVVAVSMTVTFMPLLARYYATRDEASYNQTVRSYLRVTYLISGAAGVGLSLLIPFVNRTLFEDNVGMWTLGIFVLSIPLTSMIQTYQTVYQSKNIVKAPIYAAALGLVSKVILTPFMTYYLGTLGASISTILSLAICLVVLRVLFNKEYPKVVKKDYFLIKIFCCLLMMGLVVGSYTYLLISIGFLDHSRILVFLYAIIGVGLGATTYLVSVIRLKVLNKEEWVMLPFGEKLFSRIK